MQDRIERLRMHMREIGLTAFLVSALPNLRYLFGFTGSNGMGLITSDLCFFVTDWRYRDQVDQEVRNAEIFVVQRDLLAALKQRQVLQVGDCLGFEAHHLSFQLYSQLHKLFDKVKLVATRNIVEKIAIPKDSQEIACIKQAAAIACAVWDQVLPLVRRNIMETDIAAEIVYRARKLGSETDAFDPIVTSGPRSALPHGRSSRRRLQPGDFVIIDFGCVVNGYAADVTRTVAIGEPPARLRQAHAAVLQACRLACEAARPGMQGNDLDNVARQYLESCGIKDQFSHSLGHGLGLDVHSLPRLGQDSKDVITANAVLAIEPGAYFPGLGGVRIEDDLLVTDTGNEILTPMSRELVLVE
ncbi:MAG: Xaa-Pro peptidase family protein [candidate division KSB1 bacterium]|nr:Xaa-Pro peptidase family protein [candidate division KSB1 bacterium]MDZ7303427.1 Xaa-Pro peptidase family protein [candidate division KSB1 bacterium]MDZ7312509.1 Xaa-Pro peptidase family protein [candidate division KSB1 bacterium]